MPKNPAPTPKKSKRQREPSTKSPIATPSHEEAASTTRRAPAQSSYEQAVEVRDRMKQRLDTCPADELAKYNDAYVRAATVVRQYEKEEQARAEKEHARREKNGRSIDSLTTAQLISHILTLPWTEWSAIRTTLDASLKALAKRPLF